MEGEKRASTIFILSSDKSFCKNISRIIKRYRAELDISQSDSLQEIIAQVNAHEIILLDEEYIHKNEKSVFQELFSSIREKQTQLLLFVSYRNILPAEFLDKLDSFHVVSRSLKKDEFLFHLDATERRNLETKIESSRIQDKYLDSIIQIQNLLITKPDPVVSMTTILQLIGKVTNAYRIILFENKFDYMQRLLMSVSNAWTVNDNESADENLVFNLLPFQPNYNRWEMELSSGNHIAGDISEFPSSERPLLLTQGIEKLLLLPVLIKGNFWGFLMLAFHRDSFLPDEVELELLNSAIAPIASYLEIKMEERRRDISDERLRRIFENSNIGLVLATKEGALKSFNPAFSKMLGYDEQELKNLNFRVFTHPDDLRKELPLLTDLLNGKIASYLLEKRYIRKGGSTVWVKLHVSAYSSEKGKPESLIGIVENISREKVAEKALQESEDRYRKLSNLSMEGIVLHRNGLVTDCNERFLAMFGYTRQEINGKHLIDFLADKNSMELVQTKIHHHDLHPYEAIGITKSGMAMPLELENRLVTDNEEVLHVTAFRDITERKQNEQEIRKLNTAINQSPSSIVITDHQGKIEYVNKSFCEVTGYRFDEALGKNPRILKTDFHPKEYYSELWDTISTGNTWRGVFRNKTKSGEYYWERAVVSPIIDENKQITHYLAIKENITQEKIAQEALKISEERHRIISELTNDFVYSATILKHNMHLEWSSGSLEKLVAYSILQINEMEYGWYSCILSEDLEHVVLPALNRLFKEKVLYLEYRIIAQNGEMKWVSDKIKLIDNVTETGMFIVIGAIQDITQKQEANLALDQSKQYLDSIIDNLPIGLHIFDEHGFTGRINEAQRKILGLTDKDVGKGVFNILSDPLSKSTGSDKIFKDVYEKKVTINHEFEINFNANSNQWETRKGILALNEIIFPILKPDGTVHSVIALSTDISKRIDAEKALKASEVHQKTLLKLIPDLIFVFTNDGIFKDVYTEDSSKLLLPTEYFLGKAFSEIFPGTMSDNFYSSLQFAIETGEMQSYTYEMEIDGAVFYYESRLLLSKDNEVIAIIRDITDNAVAERALKDSEEKFRELAERTQDALILISAKNKILYASPNLSRILGISPEVYARYPMKALKLIHPDDKNWIIPELNNYRKGKQESLDLQFRVMLKGSEMKWIWYRENTVFDEEHKPVRYAAVITDITANKISEEELKIAKDEAEKANRSKSAFLANISHEIRTPMNAVLGFSDLLYSRIEDPVLKGYLNSIKSSGKTLLNLLNDILDLSKIEADKMSLTPTSVNLYSVIDEVKHIFSLKALEKGLDYSFFIDNTIPKSLLLDELRIKQVLLNLIDNAIKFTEKGVIKIEVKCFKSRENDNCVDLLFAVEDTGIGIPLHLQQSIFESFRQQDDQDKKKYQGTGLGLAITKRLVELFKGEIVLKSQPKKGSRFEVKLNNIAISDQIELMDELAGNKIRIDHSALKDKIIVLLDEEKSNRDLIKEVFHHSESIVMEGENLESILPLLSGKEDLMLMEISNTDVALKNLKIFKKNKNLQGIAKIGITSLLDADQLNDLDFEYIITKPINLHELVDIVSQHFQLQITDRSVPEKEMVSNLKIKKEVLDKVIKLLEGEHYRRWESTLITSSFSEIEKFAHKIKHIGMEYELKVLQSFSDVLVMHAKNFDIDNMNDVLKSYPKIIHELKNSF